MNDINKLIKKFTEFRDERNWKQFHTPGNLAKSVVLEAAELLENFQWDQDPDINNVKEEIADVFGYLLMLCNHYDIDIIEITNAKIDKNRAKYPIEKSYGKSTKYNKL